MSCQMTIILLNLQKYKKLLVQLSYCGDRLKVIVSFSFREENFMKFVKRVSMLLAIVLTTSVFMFFSPSSSVNATTNGHTRQQAYDWAVSLIGRQVDYDGGPYEQPYQCVDPIYSYVAYLGHPELVAGNAIDFENKTLPSGWAYKENPDVGDIVVWGPGVNMGHYNDGVRKDNEYANSTYGHIGIVIGVRSSTIVTIEQNTHFNGQICAPCERQLGTALIYIDPFGDGDSVPRGTVEKCEMQNGKLFIGGWAYDPNEPSKSIRIDVYSGNTSLKSITANVYREDVNKARGISGNHGFNALIDIPSGNHNIIIYAINSAGGSKNNKGLGAFSINNSGSSTPTDSLPVGDYTYCEIREGKPFVGGWAYDPDESSKSIAVDIYVNGTMLKGIPADVYREDVNKAKGITGNHGFQAYLDLAPGTYSIELWAINSANNGT